MLRTALVLAAVAGSSAFNCLSYFPPNTEPDHLSGDVRMYLNNNRKSYEYYFEFNTCGAAPAYSSCKTPPFSGNVWLSMFHPGQTNPCGNLLFCNQPPTPSRIHNGAKYEFSAADCLPVGSTYRQRTATVYYDCDYNAVGHIVAKSATYQRYGTASHGGYSYNLTIAAPCPVAPSSHCPSHLANVESVTWTGPVNTTGSEDFDWSFTPCRPTLLYRGCPPGYIQQWDQKYTECGKANSAVMTKSHGVANGYKLYYTNTAVHPPVNSVATVTLNSKGACPRLDEPTYVGIQVTPRGAIEYVMEFKCAEVY